MFTFCNVIVSPATQSSWFCTSRLQNSCLPPSKQPWSESNTANFTRRLQSNKVTRRSVQERFPMWLLAQTITAWMKWSSIPSCEEAERLVQIQRGVVSLSQHASGALLFQKAPTHGQNHLHNGWEAALQPHRADGKPIVKAQQNKASVPYQIWAHLFIYAFPVAC